MAGLSNSHSRSFIVPSFIRERNMQMISLIDRWQRAAKLAVKHETATTVDTGPGVF